MADHNHEGMDYSEHEKTYAMFTTMVKYGSIAIAALLVLMALFLVR